MTTTHVYRSYVFTITLRARPLAFLVDFMDIPEIITSSPTLPGAFANACEALDLYLDSLQQLGRRAPKPKHHLAVLTR